MLPRTAPDLALSAVRPRAGDSHVTQVQVEGGVLVVGDDDRARQVVPNLPDRLSCLRAGSTPPPPPFPRPFSRRPIVWRRRVTFNVTRFGDQLKNNSKVTF